MVRVYAAQEAVGMSNHMGKNERRWLAIWIGGYNSLLLLLFFSSEVLRRLARKGLVFSLLSRLHRLGVGCLYGSLIALAFWTSIFGATGL